MIRIAVTDPLRTDAERDRYLSWLARASVPADPVVVAPGHASGLDGMDGLVLTGGGDVDPRAYGRPDALPLVVEVRPERDALEKALVLEALRAKIPVLGICRGMQMVNVALGGTLLPDLASAGFSGHRGGPGAVRRHRVRVEPESRLSGGTSSVVSSHHQAVDRPADGLRVTARAEDGVIEALEASGVLLVQWHPERLPEDEGPLGGGIREEFLTAVRARAADVRAAGHHRSHIQTAHTEGEQ